MAYLLTQIVFSLVLAGLLGAVIGWLVSGYRAAGKQQNVHAELMRQSHALSQAETDNKMIEDDFRELKQRSEEAVALLTEDTKQIPALKKNLEKSQTLVRQLLQKHDAELRHVQTENRVLASKMRDLENREKAVTRLQMDLNTERLKMRTQETRAQGKGPDTSPSLNTGAGKVADNSQTDQQAVAAEANPDTANPDTAIPGLQDVLPLESIELDAAQQREGDLGGHPEITDISEREDSLAISGGLANTNTSFDDILDKADDVLTRFQDDPDSDLESFQTELDQELDAIRRDLAEDVNAEAPVLLKAQPSESSVSVNTIEVDNVDRELLEQLGPATANNDLQTIFGIGPVTETTLKSIGIRSFAQIAQFKREHIEYVAEVLQIFPGRIERDNWVASAKKLLASKPSSADSNIMESPVSNPELEDA